MTAIEFKYWKRTHTNKQISLFVLQSPNTIYKWNLEQKEWVKKSWSPLVAVGMHKKDIEITQSEMNKQVQIQTLEQKMKKYFVD